MAVNSVFKLFFLLSSFTDVTLQNSESTSVCHNTSDKDFNKVFQGKVLSQDMAWRLMQKFHTDNFPETSIVYKVSDLVETFFFRNNVHHESLEEGIIVLSGISSTFGAWEYNAFNEPDEMGTNDDKNWKEIPVRDGDLLSSLAVPHWHIGAVDVENSCQDICDRISLQNVSNNCQEIFQHQGSSMFISHTKYIRFRRRRKFWNHFQSFEKTTLIFQPVVFHAEKIFSQSPKGTSYDKIPSDFAILRAEWTDCSEEPIFSQPKMSDECGMCGGDNSSCKICDKGKILYRGSCKKIEEMVPSGRKKDTLDFSPVDFYSHKESLNHRNKTDINFKKLPDKGRKIGFLKHFIELQPTPAYTKTMKTTKIKMGSIEVRGPDVVYAGDETLMQVQPISYQITNTRFTLKWKHHWHINGTLIKGTDWIQQGEKLIIAKKALKPFDAYQVTAFTEIENAPGIVYTASRILKVKPKGVCAILNVTQATTNSKLFFHLDASSSHDIDSLDNTFLQFIWKCHSVAASSLCVCNHDKSGTDEPQSTKEYIDKRSLGRKALKVDTDCLMPGRYTWSVTVFNSYSLATAAHTFEIFSKPTLNSSSEIKFKEGSFKENPMIINHKPLCMMSNECTLEKLKAISVKLLVKPRKTAENSMGTLFSFIVSFNLESDIDHIFFQKLIYSIGYLLNTSRNENLSPSDSESVLWLQTSSVLVNTNWDYLPSGENVTPVVKVCASSFQCKSTFFPFVKVALHSLSHYGESTIRKTFERKIYDMEINGAITFMFTTFISLRHLGESIVRSKIAPIFSNSIDRYTLIIADSKKSHDLQKPISSLKNISNEIIPFSSIVKRLVKRIEEIQTMDYTSASATLYQRKGKTILKNMIRVKRNATGIAAQEIDNLETLNVTNEGNGILLKEVMSYVSKMCVDLRHSNSSEAEINNTRIKVVYIKDVLSSSSVGFHMPLEILGAENGVFNSVDFGYFLKRHLVECDNRTKKMCSSVCLTAVEFKEVFFKPTVNDFDSSMWKFMAYQMNSSTKAILEKKGEQFGPVLLEFNISGIALNHTAECRVWDEGQNDWDSICNSAIISEDNDRILQCFCKQFGYIKVLETKLPIKRNVSLEDKHVQFSILNLDPDLTMGKLRSIFEVSLAEQLTKVLKISEAQVEGWEPSSGGVTVSVRLMNKVTKSRQKNHSELSKTSLESVVEILDAKIKNGTLLLMDLQNRPLNISQTSIITRRMAEEMNLVLGIIIGSILIIGVTVFSVSSFRKYRQEKLDSVRPIKNFDADLDVDKFDSAYNGNHVSSEELGSDINYDGISCIDTSEITIRRVTSMSESQPNSKRSSVYINSNITDINHPLETANGVSVTHSSGAFGLSSFPNMITN